MQKASLFERIKARAPAYWPLMREQPAWAVMFLFSRVNAARHLERMVSSAQPKPPQPVEGSIFKDLDLTAVVDSLIDEGVFQGFTLPDSIVEEVKAFAAVNPVYTKDAPTKGFLPGDLKQTNAERERDVLAAYYFESAQNCPAVLKLREDPALRSIATAYLGQPALLIRTRLWWSFPAERVSDGDLHLAAQNHFHFDIDGWRTLKFFFYLTPTDDGAGPHQYIRASHRRRKLKHQFTPTTGRPTPQLEAFYPADAFVTVKGPAGFGFAEDPFVFHTGTLCRDTPRLMLEIGFGVSAANPAYKNPAFIYGRLG
jgi:hypothetical protein